MRYADYIINKLNKSVIGQDEAKRTIVSCILKYCFQVSAEQNHLSKSSCLLVGPTGCGKSYMLKKISEIINLPIIEINAPDLTPKGWHGNNLDDEIERGLGYNKFGIVFIDELDKLCSPAIGSSGDDMHKNTQQSILKIVEGIKTNRLDTNDLLFIFGGNFPKLREFNDCNKMTPGLLSTKVNHKEEDLHKAIVESNVIPELAGRISTIVELQPITKEGLNNILDKSKDSPIKEYHELLNFYGIEHTEMSEEYKLDIIDKAYNKNLGVRGLFSYVHDYYRDVILNADIKESILILKIERDIKDLDIKRKMYIKDKIKLNSLINDNLVRLKMSEDDVEKATLRLEIEDYRRRIISINEEIETLKAEADRLRHEFENEQASD